MEHALVTQGSNVRWATGFTGSFGVLLVSAQDALFLTDSRYTIQAEEEVQDARVASFGSPKRFEEFLAEQAGALGVRELAFERSLTYDEWARWSAATPGVTWTPMGALISPLRQVKTSQEVAAIEKACGIADATLVHLERLIQVGVSEMDIRLDLELFIRRQGAEPSFEPIVVSGNRSARPHGRASEKLLEAGDFLTLDFGARVEGYCSDITRTFVVGEATERHRKLYHAVLEAQLAAIDALKPGANGREVDALSRRILGGYDLAQYFGHGLGHGLGIDVHDPGRLTSTVDQAIREGQVWTVEPGVYIEGFGGVRIEDDVLIEAGGARSLTSSPKEFRVLG